MLDFIERVKSLISERKQLEKRIEEIDALLMPLAGEIEKKHRRGGSNVERMIASRRNEIAAMQKPKRKMSAAARAKLAASAKARWKKAKEAGKTSL